jgi:hypothetical protein
MFRRQYCAIFRELTVPDQICYINVMDANTGDSESGCRSLESVQRRSGNNTLNIFAY